MSGGMRQRVMIAMALACEPDLLIADEPTTALDVTVQAQILDLLRELQQQTGMAIMLITHDLGVVAEMADEVAVMYAGRVVERAPGAAIFDDPQHPYTLGLLGSIPKIEEQRDRLLAIEGTVPPPFDLPQGCRFHPRCVFAEPACTAEDPALRELAPGPSRGLHPGAGRGFGGIIPTAHDPDTLRIAPVFRVMAGEGRPSTDFRCVELKNVVGGRPSPAMTREEVCAVGESDLLGAWYKWAAAPVPRSTGA